MRTMRGVLTFLTVLMALGWAGQSMAQTTQKASKLVVKETVLASLGSGPTSETKAFSVSPDGKHVAVMGKKGDKYFITLDGVAGKEYDWIVAKSTIFSGDSAHMAYVVQQKNTMFVVTDGKEGKPYHEILNSTLFASGTGFRMGYFAKAKPDSRPMVIIDSQDGKEYEQVGSLTFSPDGKRVAYGVETGGKAFFVIDGAPTKEYDKVSGGSFAWSPDSKRVAFGAVRDSKVLVVVDGKESELYDQASGPVFSPDSKHMAYAVQRDAKTNVVLDGKDQKAYDTVVGDTIRFSADGNQLAYLAARKEITKGKDTTDQTAMKLFYVLDGKELRAYDELVRGSFIFSSDGKHNAYVGVKNRHLVVSIDGYEGKEYEDVRLGQFSPDGQKMAYLARRDGRVYAVVDNAETVGYGSVANLLFSPDGKRMAYVAGRDKSTFIVVDGVEGKDFDGGIVAETIAFSPDGKHIAYEAQRGKDKVIVIDDQETTEYNGSLRGSRITFDGPTSMYALVLRDGNIVRLQIEIQ